ncbi:dihydroxyacetone kinase family protein [Luteococcus sp. OSA5]|uniref:dihydroxyacetone kinase family protein n=1 Tax=Luteococcus sp. OSA5 TaxID=3401630 RepID=UPI003B42B922
MTYLKHDPAVFAAQAAAGFASAHSHQISPVPGGVARATRSSQDEVALVIGGGSGHYPAFAGLVGPGLAHGAVLGNIFASPSANQVASVVRAVEQGRGVLLSYGNYAGDVLQFDQAQAELRAEGLDVRTVRVTDDISSAGPAERDRRRGIAGDLVVFKVAGAAAAQGADLDRVEEVARRANELTTSLGVAFTGCTLPGAEEPLFHVPEGRMAIGLGIHGEAGLSEVEVPTPEELAALLVERLLAERPGSARSAVVILNGLGAFKYDELFVLYGAVSRALAAQGVNVADVKVGEFCTSFEMAGCSLTLFWADEQLLELWQAPSDAPEYRTGRPPTDQIPAELQLASHTDQTTLPPAGAGSRLAAGKAVAALEVLVDVVDAHADEWGRIDAIAGDGDHGIGMRNGAHSALEAARAARQAGAGLGSTLHRAADAWSDGAGGTSGALWGLMIHCLAEACGDQTVPDGPRLRQGIAEAGRLLTERGGARVGDKTMVDAVHPFVAEMSSTDGDFAQDWGRAAQAAQTGADSTCGMLPARGRARSHGQAARDIPDPGAVSFAQIVRGLTTAFPADS